jgi:hypothetical protein
MQTINVEWMVGACSWCGHHQRVLVQQVLVWRVRIMLELSGLSCQRNLLNIALFQTLCTKCQVAKAHAAGRDSTKFKT